MLVFDGMAGNGKSTLIEWLIHNRCERDGVPWARADLVTEAARSNFADLLGQWEDGLSSAVPPPVWQTYRGRRREILDELNRQRVQITATQQFEATGSASLSGTQQQMDISKLLLHAERHARTCLTDEFLDLLCAVPGRLVLFLDTYEMLQQAGDQDTIGWLWGGLLVRTHRRCAGLRVIVGSREKLDLAHDLLALSEQVQAFSPKDCDAFLRDCGLADSALRDAIYALTRGHPLLTNMAVELWRQGQETGLPVSQQEIREGLEARVPTEWLYGRIVDRLAEPLKSAARYGALLRRFNQETLNACLPEGTPRLDDDAFREFVGRSFVERRGHSWACHDLVREAQIGWLRRQHPGNFTEFHRRAAAFFNGQWQAKKIREDSLEALYHSFWADEEPARNAWWEACDDAQLRGERAWLAELLALAESHDLARKPLEPQTQGDILFRRANWLYYGAEYPLARQRYEEARPIYHEIGDRLGEANCIQSLGDVHLQLAEYPLARQRYEEAGPSTTRSATASAKPTASAASATCTCTWPSTRSPASATKKPGPSTTRSATASAKPTASSSLGDVHLHLAEYPLARQRYEEARPIYHEIGARLGEANCISASATCTCNWPSTRSPASATKKPGPSTTRSATASAKPTASAASATCTCNWPSTRSPASATKKPGPSTTRSAPASAKPTASKPRRRAPATGRVPARPPALRRSPAHLPRDRRPPRRSQLHLEPRRRAPGPGRVPARPPALRRSPAHLPRDRRPPRRSQLHPLPRRRAPGPGRVPARPPALRRSPAHLPRDRRPPRRSGLSAWTRRCHGPDGRPANCASRG